MSHIRAVLRLDPAPLTLHYDKLVPIIRAKLPFEVTPNKDVGDGRTVPDEYLNVFGPFATDWDQQWVGAFHEDRRWDYLDAYRFKFETDAVLFKLMASEHDTQ